MVFRSHYNCWEIMNCDNLDCLARREPEIPCWEIARKAEAYHNVSNTCIDCVIYILNKQETSVLNSNELKNIIKKQVENFGAAHRGCI